MAVDIASDAIVHRLGGAAIVNLRLSATDARQTPPGISVLLGGTPQGAVAQMRQAFPNSKKWQKTTTVGSTTADAIRKAGFEIIPDATGRFPNHARVMHPQGLAGFSDDHLEALAKVLHETTGC